MKSKFKKWIAAGMILSPLLFCSGCGEKKDVKTEEEVISVKVNTVELKTLRDSLDYVGDIKAADEATVYSKVNGKIIEKRVREGDLVKKGDVIAYVDRDEVGFKFEKAPVEAFFNGVVGKIYVDIGMAVTQQTPIALVINMDTMKINLEIPEKYLPRLSLGQTAEIAIDAYPQDKFTGVVSQISPVVDTATRTASIELEIENYDHRLKTGMFARAQLILEEYKDVPVVLKEAVLGRSPDTYVYVVEENTAKKRKIKIGLQQDSYWRVLEGLHEGESVVVMGQQKLRDGTAVTVESGNNKE